MSMPSSTILWITHTLIGLRFPPIRTQYAKMAGMELLPKTIWLCARYYLKYGHDGAGRGPKTMGSANLRRRGLD